MSAIKNEEINNIQNSANIVDIIGSYVNLEKKGKNYFGLCPFHDDNNPSMSVSEEKKIFTCFVCHKTGNVFSFVQEYENISFIDAVKKVADKVGIKLDSNYQASTKYDKHYEACEIALKYYQNNLKTKDGKIAREYLKDRSINDEIIDEFSIGLSLNNNSLSELLINKGFDEQILLDSGLSNEGNNLFDVFRNRIMFPIHNHTGKVIGFSGRIFTNEDEAKYINTKETCIFKKGKILFNYHRAINDAKKNKYILLVEGQMDAIRVYSSGLKNVVATMGTALTSDHISLLKKLNVPVILCMDSDSAGEKATISNGESLCDAGVEVKVLRLTGKKDPDEYILEYGIETFIDAINNSITYFDFKLNHLKHDKNLNKVEDVSKYVNQVLKELSKTNDDILIDLTVNKLSSEYGLDKNVLLNKIIKVEPVKVNNVSTNIKRKISKNDKLSELLLYYMLNDIKYIKLFQQELNVIPNEIYQNIADDILAFYIKYNYINIADFITYEISSDNYELVLNIIDSNINSILDDNEYVGLINKIESWGLEKSVIDLKEKLKNVTDINEKLKIMDEIAKLKKRMCE